jgi:MFS transporter, DHA1 family, multidrug resistance protein
VIELPLFMILKCDGHHTMKDNLHTYFKAIPLTDKQRRQGRTVLLGNSFLMLFGYCTIISVTTLHFTHELTFTAAAVGLALAIRQMMQQGFDIFGGIIAEHIGYRASITMGCMIRSLGFVGMGLAQTIPQLCMAAFIAGFGGMFFDAAGSSALAVVIDAEERARVFSLQATINNVGAALGPLVGIAIYTHYGFLPVALLSGLTFFWIGIQTFLWLPDHVEQRASMTASHPMNIRQTIHAIILCRGYVRLVLLSMGFWIVAAQIALTVPLAANRIAGPQGVAIILGLNAFLAIPAQYPLVRYLEARFTPIQILAWSIFVTSIGMALLFIGPSFVWQIIGIIIATIGGLPIGPTTASITAQVAPPRALAAFYGFSALSIGVGGALGQYFGGRLYDIQMAIHAPWLIGFVLLALGSIFAIAMYQTPEPTRQYLLIEMPVEKAEKIEIAASVR